MCPYWTSWTAFVTHWPASLPCGRTWPAPTASLRLGLEIGVLAEIFRNCAIKRVCSVELSDNYEHKHPVAFIGDPSGGLMKMAVDIQDPVTHPVAEGVIFNAGVFNTLLSNYVRIAEDTITRYHADALIDGLAFDRHEEEMVCGDICQAIRLAADAFEKDPLWHPADPELEPDHFGPAGISRHVDGKMCRRTTHQRCETRNGKQSSLTQDRGPGGPVSAGGAWGVTAVGIPAGQASTTPRSHRQTAVRNLIRNSGTETQRAIRVSSSPVVGVLARFFVVRHPRKESTDFKKQNHGFENIRPLGQMVFTIAATAITACKRRAFMETEQTEKKRSPFCAEESSQPKLCADIANAICGHQRRTLSASTESSTASPL